LLGNRKIAVVGANGFIGKSVSNYFESKGESVQKITRTIPSQRRFYLEKNFDQITNLIWLASGVNPLTAETHPDMVAREIEEWDSFLNYAKNLKYLSQAIIVSSGGCVYTDPMLPHSENSLASGTNAYGRFKLEQERLLVESGVNFAILRASNVYGPNQLPGRGQGVIAEWINSALKRKPLVVLGDTANYRDFIYVADLSELIWNVITSGFNGIINAGSGEKTELTKVISIIQSNFDYELEISYLSSRSIDRKGSYLNITKAKELLGWNPQTSLEEGIRKTIFSHELTQQ
jgi:UDP-glucose 4-epimerase